MEDQLEDILQRTSRVPTVVSWVAAIMAASSQYTHCGEQCFRYETCDESKCSTTAWHVTQLIGK